MTIASLIDTTTKLCNTTLYTVQATRTKQLSPLGHLGPRVSNKRGAPKNKLTFRTSVITHGSKKVELALRGTFFYLVHTGLGFYYCLIIYSYPGGGVFSKI